MPTRRFRTLAVLCLLFVLASAASAVVGIDRRASFALGDGTCDDTSPEIAAQPDGTFLAVWQHCYFPARMAGQRLDAAGRKLGAQIDLGLGGFPQVAALPDRGFAIAYIQEVTADTGIFGVYARRLDPTGAPVAGPARIDEGGSEERRVAFMVPRLASAPDGRLLVGWRNLFLSPFPIPITQLPAFGRLLGADLTPLGGTFDLGSAGLFDDLDVSFDEAGRALVVSALGTVAARRFDAAGIQIGNAIEVGGGAIPAFNPHLAPRQGGGWWVTWEEQEGGIQSILTRAFLRAVDASGHPAGPRIDVGLVGDFGSTGPVVGVDPDGLALVAGRDNLGAVKMRLFDATGAPASDLTLLAGPDPFPLGRTAMAESAATGFAALWEGNVDFSPPPPGPQAGWDLRGALLAAACPSVNAVCARIGGHQAEVEVQWRLGARSGVGRGLRVGSHLLFSLENPGRFDVAVDLRGGAIDWAATTNAEVMIRWTEAGITRNATKPRGPFGSGRLEIPLAPVSPNPSATITETGQAAPTAEVSNEPAGAVAADVCAPTARTGCLFGGRFRVAAVATGADGVERPATVLAFADRQAVLAFAEAGGATVSLIDGRANNSKIWVYWGGLSKAAFRIEVTDVSTGTLRTYSNPAGKRQSRADRQAF